jgi:hypothetical protein
VEAGSQAKMVRGALGPCGRFIEQEPGPEATITAQVELLVLHRASHLVLCGTALPCNIRQVTFPLSLSFHIY